MFPYWQKSVKMLTILSLHLLIINSNINLAFAADLLSPSSAINDAVIKNFNNNSIKTKENIIDCNKDNTDGLCNSVVISRTEIPLKSYLKKWNGGFLYSINNNSQNPIEISAIYGYVDPTKTIADTKFLRNPRRFPCSLLVPIAGTLILPMEPLMYGLSYHPKTNFFNFLGFSVSYFYVFFIQSVKDTIVSPYYLIFDPINDNKAIEESKKFNSKSENITLKPHEIVQFYFLLDIEDYTKDKSFWGDTISILKETSLRKIWIKFKDTNSGKIYEIQK